MHQNENIWKIPDEIKEPQNLRVLKLLGVGIDDTFPKTITQLSKLQSLELEYNGVQGPVPPSIINLTDLTELVLVGNSITEGTDIPKGAHRLVVKHNRRNCQIAEKVRTIVARNQAAWKKRSH